MVYYNFGYCPCCGERIICQNDFDASDVYGEEVEGIISYYHCPECDILLEAFYDEEACTTIRILD